MSSPRTPSPIMAKTKAHHYTPLEIAGELTLHDSQLLRKIRPEELKGGAWMKKDKVRELIKWQGFTQIVIMEHGVANTIIPLHTVAQ